MKRYYVSVTEHLNKVVSVDAESENEAVQKVQDAYNNSDIILDADNFSGEVNRDRTRSGVLERIRRR